jgi:hypothetical protein
VHPPPSGSSHPEQTRTLFWRESLLGDPNCCISRFIFRFQRIYSRERRGRGRCSLGRLDCFLSKEVLMSYIATSSITFCLIFGAGLLGMLLRRALPQDHLSEDSKDVVKLGMGLIGTMAALVLGLLIYSAKASYDTQSTALLKMSADIIWLDRTLERYGPEAQPPRELLRSEVVHIMDRLWPQKMSEMAQLTPTGRLSGAVYDSIESLSPKDDRQRLLRSEGLVLATQIGQARWLMYEQGTTMVSKPLVVVVVFWLTFIFLSWGLFAPVNGTVIATFFIAAFSVSAALFLVQEMYMPYAGILRVSSIPLRAALSQLGQ